MQNQIYVMLKSVLLLLIIVIAVSTSGVSQGIQGAFAFGGNLSQVDGDEVYGFKKIGINTSAIAIIPFKKKWAISIEASFAQKGAYQKWPREMIPGNDLPFYNLTLNYAEVPLLLHFTDKGFFTIGIGMSWGRLVGVKEIEWGNQTPLGLNTGDYSRNDANWIVDLRFPVLKKFKKININFRYAYSVSKIRTRKYSNMAGNEWERTQFNNILTLRLYYIFNERIDK